MNDISDFGSVCRPAALAFSCSPAEQKQVTAIVVLGLRHSGPQTLDRCGRPHTQPESEQVSHCTGMLSSILRDSACADMLRSCCRSSSLKDSRNCVGNCGIGFRLVIAYTALTSSLFDLPSAWNSCPQANSVCPHAGVFAWKRP